MALPHFCSMDIGVPHFGPGSMPSMSPIERIAIASLGRIWSDPDERLGPETQMFIWNRRAAEETQWLTINCSQAQQAHQCQPVGHERSQGAGPQVPRYDGERMLEHDLGAPTGNGRGRE